MIAIFPEITKIVSSRQIENLGCAIRLYFAEDHAYTPSICLEQILLRMGIQVVVRDINGYGALLAEDMDGRFRVTMIIHPKICEEGTKKLLMAHLLGHFLLHIQPSIVEGVRLKTGYIESILPTERLLEGFCSSIATKETQHDEEADHFALSLLLPIGMLMRAKEKLKDTHRIADFFGLAEPLVKFRIQQLYDQKLETAGLGPTAEDVNSTHELGSLNQPVPHQDSSNREFLPNQNSSARDPSPQPAKETVRSSIVRGQMMIADQRYRNHPQHGQMRPLPQAKANDQKESLLKSLKRLRQIAKRLDSSVDV